MSEPSDVLLMTINSTKNGKFGANLYNAMTRNDDMKVASLVQVLQKPNTTGLIRVNFESKR